VNRADTKAVSDVCPAATVTVADVCGGRHMPMTVCGAVGTSDLRVVADLAHEHRGQWSAQISTSKPGQPRL
jgi:hypothetical protein